MLNGRTVIRHQMVTASGRLSKVKITNSRHKVNRYRRALTATGVWFREYVSTVGEEDISILDVRDSSGELVCPEEPVTVFVFGD